MNERPAMVDINARARELAEQLSSWAKFYRAMGAGELADEFERLKTVEVEPIIDLSAPETSS